MAVIWETIDRLGRAVMLTDEGWAHILDHHGDMVEFQGEIRQAIEFADEVSIDGRYRRRNVHYLKSAGGRPPIRVVVNYSPSAPSGSTGRVVTAFRSERKTVGERLIWP